jgi:hypothetical protein
VYNEVGLFFFFFFFFPSITRPVTLLGLLGCCQGYVPVISVEGLHQLHLFIFVLAVIHVLYSCFTVLVGLAQVSIFFLSAVLCVALSSGD